VQSPIGEREKKSDDAATNFSRNCIWVEAARRFRGRCGAAAARRIIFCKTHFVQLTTGACNRNRSCAIDLNQVIGRQTGDHSSCVRSRRTRSSIARFAASPWWRASRPRARRASTRSNASVATRPSSNGRAAARPTTTKNNRDEGKRRDFRAQASRATGRRFAAISPDSVGEACSRPGLTTLGGAAFDPP